MAGLGLAAVVLVCAGSALQGAAPVPAAQVAPARPAVQREPSAGPVLLDCLGRSQTHPSRYLLACGDGNNYLVSLHWSQWGTTTARAVGTDVANDCVPYCAAGHFHDYPVVISLDEVQPWVGHPGVERFTRLTAEYPGARPAGLPKQVSYRLPMGPVTAASS